MCSKLQQCVSQVVSTVVFEFVTVLVAPALAVRTPAFLFKACLSGFIHVVCRYSCWTRPACASNRYTFMCDNSTDKYVVPSYIMFAPVLKDLLNAWFIGQQNLEAYRLVLQDARQSCSYILFIRKGFCSRRLISEFAYVLHSSDLLFASEFISRNAPVVLLGSWTPHQLDSPLTRSTNNRLP